MPVLPGRTQDGDGTIGSEDRGGLVDHQPAAWSLRDFRRWHFDLFPSVAAVGKLFERLDADTDGLLTASEAVSIAAEVLRSISTEIPTAAVS